MSNKGDTRTPAFDVEQAARHEDGDVAALFARNRRWAEGKTRTDPSFFTRLVGQQKPRYFWIGCSDSRVPATEIVDLDPGEMFVHRNVANLTLEHDPSFTAALQFAVEVLKVRHVMVVGHYGCGGVQAAMTAQTADPIGRWLAPLRALNHEHSCANNDDGGDPNKLCERNVRAQVQALATNHVILSSWKERPGPTLHGWVYAIADGLLQPVCEPVRNPFAATGFSDASQTAPRHE